MISTARAGTDAVQTKGWWRAQQWLILRRLTQLSILALFLAGPWFGVWLVKGNLSSSLTLDSLPLTDPYVLLQSLVAGHLPGAVALGGAVIVLLFYLLVGGRVYCSWVCPVNIITDAAHWFRVRLDIRSATRLSRSTRYWMLGMTLVLAFVTGSLAWELVNPVSMVHRGLIFGMGLAWFVLAGVFMLDLLVSKRAWCGHVCPMGAFYSLLTIKAPLRIRADAREHCNDCMDCFAVCPEPHVIHPALKGADKGIGPVINSANCTNCGRCIDVCAQGVFHFGMRFNNNSPVHKQSSHAPGTEVLR